MTRRIRLSLALGAAVALLLGAVALRSQGARAIAPCTPHTNSAEEWTMLALVQDFRDDYFGGSPQLTMSGPLNEAAKGYATLLAQTPGSGGHTFDGAQPWDRAEACGYLTNSSQATGGEGIAVFMSAGGSPQQALDQMKEHLGSGIYTPAQFGFSYTTSCAGIAKSTSGSRVVWIVMLFARSGPCPEPAYPQAAPTNTPTSPTATHTTVPPTATPTEALYKSFSPLVGRAD